MKKVVQLFAVVFGLLTLGSAVAGKPITPEQFQGVRVVDTAFVKENLGKITIYDVRKKAEFVESHLPGSIHAEYKEKTPKSIDFDSSRDKFKGLKNITVAKSDDLVVYCNGPRCWRSFKAAVSLRDMGYSNVLWYRDGFPAWKKAGHPVDR